MQLGVCLVLPGFLQNLMSSAVSGMGLSLSSFVWCVNRACSLWDVIYWDSWAPVNPGYPNLAPSSFLHTSILMLWETETKAPENSCKPALTPNP